MTKKQWTEVTSHAKLSGVLKCPSCNHEYTHHVKTKVFNRSAEDAKHGTKLTIERATVSFDASMDKNPSARRDGIRIYFYCEECHHDSLKSHESPPLFQLVIYQHKGNTFVETLHYVEVTS